MRIEPGDEATLNLENFMTLYLLDVPLMPTALRLDPNPGDVGQLIFSWLAPPDTLNGIALTYIPAVTGLLLNQTRDTSTVFDDDPSLECLLREFSVFASNAAGSGPVATINETIPICELPCILHFLRKSCSF